MTCDKKFHGSHETKTCIHISTDPGKNREIIFKVIELNKPVGF